MFSGFDPIYIDIHLLLVNLSLKHFAGTQSHTWYSKLKFGLVTLLNPLSPKLDENEISLYMITACLNIQVSRIKEVITDDGMS